MLEYLGMVYNIGLNQYGTLDLPMERLKIFEEECQGLFAPLDLSPATESSPPPYKTMHLHILLHQALCWNLHQEMSVAASASSPNLPLRPKNQGNFTKLAPFWSQPLSQLNAGIEGVP
jgi:hypothetical protein